MFQFMTSTRIIFGEGALESSLSVLNQFGYSVLLVTGKDLSRSNVIVEYLQNAKYALSTCLNFWRAKHHYG